jgi:hypothetical protein
VAFVTALVVDAPAIGRVDDRTLAWSVADAVGTTSPYDGVPSCERAGSRWECTVGDADSGIAGYRVTMEGRRCWTARRMGRSPGMPRTVRGCATLRQQLDISLF